MELFVSSLMRDNTRNIRVAKTVFILDCWLFVSNISWPGKQGKVSWAGQLQG